jgi:hypothetical protein
MVEAVTISWWCVVVVRSSRNSSTHIDVCKRPAGQQLVCDCGCACREDCDLEDGGEAAIWFIPVDRHEEESAD